MFLMVSCYIFFILLFVLTDDAVVALESEKSFSLNWVGLGYCLILHIVVVLDTEIAYVSLKIIFNKFVFVC